MKKIKKGKEKNAFTKNNGKEVKQIINAFYNLLCSLKFEQKIQEARKELEIPTKGIRYTVEDTLNFKYGNYEPSGWKPVYPNRNALSKEWSYLWVEGILKNLIKEIGQDSSGVHLALRIYIFHNIIDEDILYENAQRQNIASIADNIEEFEEYGYSSKVFMGFSKEKNINYPLSLRVSSYASKEQLLSFINNNWTTITKIQNKYKTKNKILGTPLRTREKQNNEINLYITQNYTESNISLVVNIEKKFTRELTEGQIRSQKYRIKHNRANS